MNNPMHAHDDWFNQEVDPDIDLEYKDQELSRMSWNAALAWQAARAQDGWQLVPVDPTESMVDAGASCNGSTPSAYREAIRTYREMLNAAPKPQEPTK